MHSIFIIEDSSVDFKVLERAFKLNNFQGSIQRFSNPETALAELRKLIAMRDLNKLPKLVLSDINMPGLTGFDFCETLMKDEHLVIIPTILISNSNNPEDIKKAYKSGAKTLLNKRLDFEDQVADVKILLDYWLNGPAQIY